MASYPEITPAPYRRRPQKEESGSGALLKIVALMLGLAVGVLAVVAVVVMQAADEARDDVNAGAVQPEAATQGQATPAAADHNVSLPIESFAGKVAPNADQLAVEHAAYDASLPALQTGDVVKVNMVMKDKTVEIAPGVEYKVWAFDGDHTAPGPIVHVRQGQTVEFTLTNGGSIPHSMDFHAARIAPDKAFKDVMPGESFTFRFKADDPGVFMYHCGTKPVLAHIANGMYGAIIVRPNDMPKADREYALVASEWYLDGDGISKPASLSMEKARAMTPDWTTFNGYANQYVTHPLEAKPGETVRFWVVAAGPTLDTNFHVVGTIFDRAWTNGDMTRAQQGVQTVGVPAGGGAAFDVKIDEPGMYPFVSHAFAHVDLGQVGLLKVGNPKGTASH
ncbi:MAG: multicopper oxidase domain-containing protein [Gaiellaceae bacterium]